MKKIIIFIFAFLFISASYGSKLSKFIRKMDEKEKVRQQQEWQNDMNFADAAFRLDRRYSSDDGEACRDYIFRSRSNPYRHGHYIVCEER